MKKGFTAEREELFEKEFTGYIDKKGVVGYRAKTITAGNQREVEIYPIYKSRRDLKRGNEYQKPSEAAVAKYNKKNSQKRLIRLLNANFTEKDIWGTFTYDNEHLPEDVNAAKRFVQRYLRRLDYWMKKRGLGDLKYVYVTEYINDGKKIRIHHHIVMNFPDRDIAEKKWNGGARTQTRRLQPDEFGLEGLARYITKSRSVKYEKMWAASKNLKKPKITVSDTLFTRKKVSRLAEHYEDAVEILEKINPKFKLTALNISVSDFISGAYIYAKLCRVRQ